MILNSNKESSIKKASKSLEKEKNNFKEKRTILKKNFREKKNNKILAHESLNSCVNHIHIKHESGKMKYKIVLYFILYFIIETLAFVY